MKMLAESSFEKLVTCYRTTRNHITSQQIQIATVVSLFFTGPDDVLTVPSPPLARSGPTGTNFQCLRSVAQFRFQAGSHQSATAQAKQNTAGSCNKSGFGQLVLAGYTR